MIPDFNQYFNISSKEKEKVILLFFIYFSNKFNDLNDSIRPVIYEKDNMNKQKIENVPPFDFSGLSPEELNLNHFESNYLSYYPNGNYQFYDDEVNLN